MSYDLSLPTTATVSAVNDVYAAVQAQLQRKRKQKLRINMAGVEALDTMMAQLLCATVLQCIKQRVTCTLHNVPPEVLAVLHKLALEPVLNVISDTEDER